MSLAPTARSIYLRLIVYTFVCFYLTSDLQSQDLDTARAALNKEIRENRENLGRTFDRASGREVGVRHYYGRRRHAPRGTPLGVEGSFVERSLGVYVFIPTNEKLPSLVVANPSNLNALAVGSKLRVTGDVDAGTGRLTVSNYSLAITPEDPDPEAMEEPVNKTRAAIQSAVEVLNRGLKPGAMSTNDRSLAGSSSLARATVKSWNDIVAAYQQAVERCRLQDAQCSSPNVTEIVQSWSEFKSGVIQPIFEDIAEDKALYERMDNYEPWRYEQIVQDADAAVAIAVPGETTARCSGVLIADDLILTAAHCFSGNPPKSPSELEVWFDYSVDRNQNIGPKKVRKLDEKPVAPPLERWPELMQTQFSEKIYDYAIVRIKKTDEPLIPNNAKPKCVKESSIDRGAAIYVLGYPRGGVVRIHANAHVYLPYRLHESEMWRVRLDMHADLAGESDVQKYLDEFDKSYIHYVDKNKFSMRVFHDSRDTGHPRMAIIADLFKGNSGGPVFEHVGQQCVVGILNRGMPDIGQRLKASWKQHERVLPMEAILEDLKKNPETAPIYEMLDRK